MIQFIFLMFFQLIKVNTKNHTLISYSSMLKEFILEWWFE